MKRIKFIYLLLFVSLAIIQFSCKDDLPLPEIKNVEIVGGENTDGTVKITTGEQVTFTLTVDNVAVDRYEWFVGNELKSKDDQFIFIGEKRGTYAVHVKVYNKDGGITEKSIGKVYVIDVAPVIESLTIDGKETQDTYAITSIADSVKVEVKVTNVDIDSYKWFYNDNEVKNATNTLKILPKYSGTLKLILTNLDGIETERTITLEGKYKNGLFFYGTTYNGLSFYNFNDDTFEKGNGGDLYTQINKESLGEGGINDIVISNNKIYFLLPSSKEYKAQVVVADAQTLVKIDIATALHFDTKTLGEIYNLAIVDDDKAYIGYNNSVKGNISGVRVLNMKEKTLSEPIEGTTGKMGVDGPGWVRMLKNKEDILVACGSKLQIIDGKTDKVKKTIERDKDRQIVDVVKGRDGFIYLLVNGKVDKSSPYWAWSAVATTSPSIVKVNSNDYAVVKEDELLIDEKAVGMAGGLKSASASASSTTDNIYFIESGWSADKVYVYNYTSGKVKKFASISGKKGLHDKFSGYLGVDNKGSVFVPTTNYMSSNVGKFASDGTYSEEIYHVNGDANVISTNQFK